MNAKHFLIAALFTTASIQADNPFHNLPEDLSVEQVKTLFQNEDLNNYVDELQITFYAKKKDDSGSDVWHNVLEDVKNYTQKTTSTSFSIDEMTEFLKIIFDKLVASDAIHGKISINLSKNDENENNTLELGYEKS